MAVAKGMTGEQLEQVMASQSPEVAKALQEKYRTQAAVAQSASQQQLDSLERIITELKSGREISGQQMTDFMNRLERTGINGQEMLRDVGVAAGGRFDQPGQPLDAKQLKDLTDKVEELKKKLNSPNLDYRA